MLATLRRKSTTRTTRTLALLDADAPAKAERKFGFDAVREAATSPDVTREPDITDTVTGERIWFNEARGFAIVVQEENLDAFRTYVWTRCMTAQGADAWCTQDREFTSTVRIDHGLLLETVKPVRTAA